jgi:hypothetical protein
LPYPTGGRHDWTSGLGKGWGRKEHPGVAVLAWLIVGLIAGALARLVVALFVYRAAVRSRRTA